MAQNNITPEQQLHKDVRILATLNETLPRLYALADALDIAFECGPAIMSLEAERTAIQCRFAGQI